ncbi:MAG: glycosyltransferase, partial [Chloroflexota bacterium]|nr:glycosyltransferase [Chloroflexota bacterium]
KFIKIINSHKPKLVLAAKNFPLAILLKKFSNNNFKLILREAVDPYVAASIQRNYISERIILFIKKMLYPKSDRIIAISHGVKDSLVDKLAINSKMINVIYNPAADEKIIDLSQEITDDYSFKNYTIVNIGRLTKQKDHLTLLKAFKIVIKKAKCNLIIIGEGSEKENIENYIRNNDLGNYVKLLGYKSNPWKYLSRSNLFVLSSIWEGFGNVIVESMLLGIPVISTRCKSGPAEILDNGKYGKLYDIYDYTKLSELILNEISSKELENSSNIAKKRSEDFSIDKITESYIKYLDELLT